MKNYEKLFLVFGMDAAPPAEDGFLATWVWYENVRQKLKKISSGFVSKELVKFLNHRWRICR